MAILVDGFRSGRIIENMALGPQALMSTNCEPINMRNECEDWTMSKTTNGGPYLYETKPVRKIISRKVAQRYQYNPTKGSTTLRNFRAFLKERTYIENPFQTCFEKYLPQIEATFGTNLTRFRQLPVSETHKKHQFVHKCSVPNYGAPLPTLPTGKVMDFLLNFD